MWTIKDLERATQPTKDARAKSSAKIQSAALAYARYQKLTDEPDIDVNQAKGELDALIDEIRTDDIWNSREEHPIALMRDLTLYKQQRDAELANERTPPRKTLSMPGWSKDDDLGR